MGFLGIHKIKEPGSKSSYTFIGETCRVEGRIEVNGELVINGTVEGTIRCDTLFASKGSKIKGRIKARNATLSGIVESEVEVSEHLAINQTGELTGSISYGTLSVEPGGILSGKCLKVDSKGTKVVALEQIGSVSANY